MPKTEEEQLKDDLKWNAEHIAWDNEVIAVAQKKLKKLLKRQVELRKLAVQYGLIEPAPKPKPFGLNGEPGLAAALARQNSKMGVKP